jgi:hypothetical protein
VEVTEKEEIVSDVAHSADTGRFLRSAESL